MASHRSPPATRSKGKRGTKRKAAAPTVRQHDASVSISADVESTLNREESDDEWADLGKTSIDEWGAKPDEPISLPYGPTVAVPFSVKQKIWRGEFIALSSFLEETKVKQPYGYHPCSASKDPESKRRPLADIHEWTDAFLEYMAIYVAGGEVFAARTPALLGYIKTIRFAAKKWKGVGWRHYDEKFRQLMAAKPSTPWDLIDPNMWLLYVTAPAPFPERSTAFPKGGAQYNRATRPAYDGKKAGARVPRTCKFFNNTGNCKFSDKCAYAHACAKCGAPHPAVKCSK